MKKFFILIVFPLFISFQGCGQSEPQEVVKKYLESKTPEEHYKYMIIKDDYDKMMIRNQGEVQYKSISSSPRKLVKGLIIVDFEVIEDGETIPAFYILSKDKDGQYKVDLHQTIGFRAFMQAMHMAQPDAEAELKRMNPEN